MEAIIWTLLIAIVCIGGLVLALEAANEHTMKQREREAAELKAQEIAKAKEAQQAQRIARAKRRLDAEATAAEELIKEAVARPARKRRG